jgi:hypothetical protein
MRAQTINIQRYIRIVYQLTFSIFIASMLSTVKQGLYSDIDGQMSSKYDTKQKQSQKLYVDHN